MPYIETKDRIAYADALNNIEAVLKEKDWKKGHFNFCVSILLKKWVAEKGLSYNTLSDITGVLNDIKTEFERKVVGPYEEEKAKKNGEVY